MSDERVVDAVDEGTLVSALAQGAGLPADAERIADLRDGWPSLAAALARIDHSDVGEREPHFAPSERDAR